MSQIKYLPSIGEWVDFSSLGLKPKKGLVVGFDIDNGEKFPIVKIEGRECEHPEYRLVFSDVTPTKSPEQIAAEERSKACDAMFGIMTSPPVREGNRSDMAEALYDAGYRKLEIVENEK